MNLDVDLVGAAALMHYRYAWWRANWRRMVDEEGFPPPFRGAHKGGRPWWRAQAIEAWKDQRSGLPSLLGVAGVDAQPVARPANDPLPRPLAPKARVSALLMAAGAPASLAT